MILHLVQFCRKVLESSSGESSSVESSESEEESCEMSMKREMKSKRHFRAVVLEVCSTANSPWGCWRGRKNCKI